MSLTTRIPELVINENTNAMSVGSTGGLSTTVIIGTAMKGDLLTPQVISDVSSLVNLFGIEDQWDMDNIPTPLGLVRGCKLHLAHSNNLKAIRVASSSASKASAKIYPDEVQYQEFLGDGVETDFTLKAVPADLTNYEAVVVFDSTTYRESDSSLVYDNDSPGAGVVSLTTKGGTTPGLMICGDTPTDGAVIDVKFYVDLDDIQVCEIEAKSEGTWGHDINYYVETTTGSALIENQEISGVASQRVYALAYDRVPKSVYNYIYLENKTNETDQKKLTPIYIRSDTTYHKGEKTDSYLLDSSTKKLAQIFKTIDSITVDSATIRIKSNNATGTDDVTVRIETLNDDNEPSGTLIDANATGTITGTDISDSYQDLDVEFTDEFVLSANTQYALVISQPATTDDDNIESIDYDEDENPRYTDGDHLYYDGSDWDDTNKDNSLIFAIHPADNRLKGGQCVVIMRSWGDQDYSNHVARIKLSDFDTNQLPIEDYNINAKYRVEANSNINKLVINYNGSIEEYIVLSGTDLARDINNNSAFLEATADSTNAELLPSAIENGSLQYPLTLSGGDNGEEATPSDFQDAINQLEYLEDVYFIVIASAGRYDHPDDLLQLHTNLVSHARKMTNTRNQYRIAIVGMRSRESGETFGEFSESAPDSISSRLDVLADENGLSKFVGMGLKGTDESPFATSSTVTLPGCMIACLQAGLWSSVPENITTAGKAINWASDLEFDIKYSEKDTLLQLGAECYEKSGGIRVVGGVLTDQNAVWLNENTRRIVHYIYAREYAELKPLLNELNEEDLWEDAESKLLALFLSLKKRKFISSSYSVKVDATRAEQAEGLAIVNQYFEPLYPIRKFYLDTRIG